MLVLVLVTKISGNLKILLSCALTDNEKRFAKETKDMWIIKTYNSHRNF